MSVLPGPWRPDPEKKQIEQRLAASLEGATRAIASLATTAGEMELETRRAVSALEQRIAVLEERLRVTRRGRLLAWIVAAGLAVWLYLG